MLSIEIFKDKESLLRKAKEVSEKSLNDYQESVFLYFIARYFVSVYEAKFGAIPIQVWNEYRNALDHFFRHTTNTQSTHLKKMQGHLQRAALDILKIYCHSVQEKIKLLKSEFDTDIIKLVDNGQFYKNLNINMKKSEDLFIIAKVQDNSLGDDSHTNKEILSKYLDAVFSFDEIYTNIISKSEDINYAKDNYNSIHNHAAKGTFWHHIKTHYIFYISWTIFSLIVQFIYNNYFPKI
jgi:hypothetical protein